MEKKLLLSPDKLSNHCDPRLFSFETSNDIVNPIEFIGQKRAYEAIRFGIQISHNGYNLYALGPETICKRQIITSILQQEACKKKTPSDWCYVYNFKNPRYPLALQLPAGMGHTLKIKMKKLIKNLKVTLPAIFETMEHQARIKQLNLELTTKQKEYFDSLIKQAEENGMTILSTSKGFIVVPIKGGKIVSENDLELLSTKERKQTDEITEELNEQLAHVIKEVQKLHKKRRKQEKAFDREFALDAVDQLITKIKNKFQQFSQVLHYLDEIKKDILSNVNLFLKTQETATSTMWGESHPSEFEFSRYQINVIIDNSKTQGAPIIYEDNPRDYNLIGRIEHVSQFGALVTDFTLIRRGALHQANGGYLILDIDKIIDQFWSWEALKRALQTKQIKIELPPHSISITSTSTLEPEPIPLDLKVILIGTRQDYYYLQDHDPLFNELFKVAVDFDETIPRTEETIHLYANLIAAYTKKYNTRPLDRCAVAKMVDYSCRLVEDSEKMSLNLESLINLLQESDHWAEQKGQQIIRKEDVEQTINCQQFRLNRYQHIHYEDIKRNIVLINTIGNVVGQINALTTYRFGEFSFGFPSRITASARIGREGIIDIEREANLSGPIHAKGILILSGFLRSRYATNIPLTLSASIVFEQSYGSIDGDSASVAELCSLLSSLSGIAIKQNLAVTGSINQLGIVQAIGNVNEKIEGFFDICQSKGLTGDQGVLIPKSNVKNLMLRKDVIEAVRKAQYHIYEIENIDQALSLLTGLSAGSRDVQGNYPQGTVNFLVEKQLHEFAKINKKWNTSLL